MRLYRWSLLLWLLTATLFLTACNPDFTVMAERRQEHAKKNTGEINIVVLQDIQKSNYLNGAILAAEQINQRPAKLLNRPLKIITEQDRETFDDIKSTIRRIAFNPQITAVLGHRHSNVAVPASTLYERSELVFMSSFATSKTLTKHNYQYTFRMMPSTEIKAGQMASVAKTLGYQRMVVLYARDDLSSELAFLFEEAAIKQGIELVQRASFFANKNNYRSIISQIKSEEFDAIFIAAPSSPTGLMARQLREMGIQHPIIGDDILGYTTEYQQVAGAAAEKTIIPSIYTLGENNVTQQQFIKRYQSRFGQEPDYSAAQGYDSLNFLVAAIERAGSTLPPLLASTLHYMPARIGVTGIHAFDQDGEMRGKKYTFKSWLDGQWQNLPAIHVPYLLGRFEKNLQSEEIPQSNVATQQNSARFSQAFTEHMHEDDHKTFLLDLAHEVLQFKRIGVVFENTAEGRKAADYQIITTLAEQKDLTVIGCEVFFSLISIEDTKRALVDCYGKLSMNVDAVFVPQYSGIDAQFLRQLHENLMFFKIPSISLDEGNTDPNISFVLSKRKDIDQKSYSALAVYRNLLSNLKVHEFATRLKGLPDISVNLSNLQNYDLSENTIIDLSPDNFLLTNEMLEQEGSLP